MCVYVSPVPMITKTNDVKRFSIQRDAFRKTVEIVLVDHVKTPVYDNVKTIQNNSFPTAHCPYHVFPLTPAVTGQSQHRQTDRQKGDVHAHCFCSKSETDINT